LIEMDKEKKNLLVFGYGLAVRVIDAEDAEGLEREAAKLNRWDC